jgi:tetratricopeptide (TPR) repeat protein
MVIDERADHSMRVPRPDLSLEIGTPNACSQCHQDKPIQWAADATERWYGKDEPEERHFGQALYAGRTGAPRAGALLMDLAVDTEQPAIARATALDLLRRYPSPRYLMALPRLLADPSPLVRGSAVRYLAVTDPQTLFSLGMPLLDDPVRVVRLEAARTLAPLVRHELPDAARERLASALEAYRAAQLVNAERPESHLNIGLAATAQGKAAVAQSAYRRALALDPGFVPAYVNLADLYRALGSDREGETVLRSGLAAAPRNADLHHALGLLHIRGKRTRDAVEELKAAAELDPGTPRYAYVYALALQETGDVEGALQVLDKAQARHPASRDILTALVAVNRGAGRLEAAKRYAQEMSRRYPDDPETAALLRELSSAQ